jgi:trigger factor
MKTELVDVNETRKNLVIEIPTDVVDAEIAKVSAQYGRSVKLPGFRPGKVPPKVIKQRFKREILHDVAHELVERAVGEALQERGVEPVAAPDIRDLKLEEGHPLTFKAEFDVVPPFDPGEFGSIEVRRSKVNVEDEAVDQALERLRERAARYEPVETGAAETGYTLVVDVERQPFNKEGQAGDKEKHEGIPIEVGAKANPPGLDDQLIGMRPNETKSFRLRYPDDYAVPELAGTEVAYTVRLHDMRKRVVPVLDDEFAKDLGEFETLAALRDRVRQDLEGEAREANDRQVRNDVLKKLAERVPFPVPGSLVDREIDRRVEDFAHRLMDQRIDPRKTNIDWAAFREGQREPARDAVASAIVLDQIVQRDDVRISEAEIDAELERYAHNTGLTVPAVRARIEQEGGLPRLVAGMRREKALSQVMSQARVVEL